MVVKAKRRLLPAALLAGALATLAVAGQAQPTKELLVPGAEATPTIDGKLDDVCWRTAAAGNGFVLRGIGRPETEPTEFLVCYDSDSLYFAFHCRDSRP